MKLRNYYFFLLEYDVSTFLQITLKVHLFQLLKKVIMNLNFFIQLKKLKTDFFEKLLFSATNRKPKIFFLRF